MKLVYFAWVRERVGRPDEETDVPEGVSTVGELVGWLRSRGPEYESAFAGGASVRAAIDRRHVKPEASIAGAREIAFFPPMTGG